MARVGQLRHASNNEVLLDQVRWCSSFGCKLRGLMFRGRLKLGEGLLMVEALESRSLTSIHMLCMSFPIAAIWMDKSFTVVDKQLAKPWRLAYVPKNPARYTLEADPLLLDRINVGDTLVYEVNPI